MAYATVTLTGKYVAIDGTAAQGSVDIRPTTSPVLDAEGNVVLAGGRRVTLDAAGAFTLALPATDDAGLDPTGFGYTVTPRLHHESLRPVTFGLPASLGALDMADVTPADPAADYAPVLEGPSAYDVAVTNGFVGTEAEWLASLVGPTGPQGPEGPAGSNAWTEITGKPAAFPPEVHAHSDDEVTGFAPVAYSGAYTDLSGQPAIPDSADDVGAVPTTSVGTIGGPAGPLGADGRIPSGQTSDTGVRDLLADPGTASGALLSDTYAPLSVVEDIRTPRTNVVLLGDSIVTQNTENIGTANARGNARGFFIWANALLGQRFTQVNASNAEGEFGGGGKTAAQLISEAHHTAAAAADADWAVVLAGTNDIGLGATGAAVAADLLTIWQTLLDSGKRVVACTILPRAEGTDTAAMRDALREANRLIRANARGTRGVILCDWYAYMVEPSTGQANLNYLSDGVHPDQVGASRMGKALADTLAPITPPAAGILPFDNADVRSLMPNPFMLGDTSGGATSTNFYAVGAGTYVKSKVARSDGIAGEWQQIVVTAPTPNVDGAQIQQQNTAVGVDWNVGDTVYAVCEFETDAAGWGGRDMRFTMEFFGNGSAGGELYTTGGERTALTANLLRPERGILRTPQIIVPVNTTRIQLNFFMHGPGTWRVGRYDAIKV